MTAPLLLAMSGGNCYWFSPIAPRVFASCDAMGGRDVGVPAATPPLSPICS
jgi:hypothetical protein